MRKALGSPQCPAGFSDLNAKGESTFLVSSAAYSKDVFDDLWKQFGSEYGDVIAGWYLPFEFNNDAVKNENGSLPRLIKNFYQPLTNHIKSVTPDKPILISPLVYAPLTEAPTADKLDQWRRPAARSGPKRGSTSSPPRTAAAGNPP